MDSIIEFFTNPVIIATLIILAVVVILSLLFPDAVYEFPDSTNDYLQLRILGLLK